MKLLLKDLFRVSKMPKKSSKKSNPAKCDLCGVVRHEFVILLVNPDPVKHETWCDDCYIKAMQEKENERQNFDCIDWDDAE